MRSFLQMLCAMLLAFTVCGCTQTDNHNDENDSSVIQEDSQNEEVDYDLTEMNKDMVYATVSQMLMDPESYVGKTVRMNGPFSVYTNMDYSVYYPACIIEDALACCATGMEFVVTGATYPDDFPAEGTYITVTGTFETYQEGDVSFCHINNAEMMIEGS